MSSGASKRCASSPDRAQRALTSSISPSFAKPGRSVPVAGRGSIVSTSQSPFDGSAQAPGGIVTEADPSLASTVVESSVDVLSETGGGSPGLPLETVK